MGIAAVLTTMVAAPAAQAAPPAAAAAAPAVGQLSADLGAGHDLDLRIAVSGTAPAGLQLNGATFTFTEPGDRSATATCTTDVTGLCQVSRDQLFAPKPRSGTSISLPAGTYTVAQTGTVAGLGQATGTSKLRICGFLEVLCGHPDRTVTLPSLYRTQVQVSVTTAADSPVTGATYTLTAPDYPRSRGGSTVTVGPKTSDKGLLTFTGAFRPGSYTLTATSTVKGHLKDAPVTFTMTTTPAQATTAWTVSRKLTAVPVPTPTPTATPTPTPTTTPTPTVTPTPTPTDTVTPTASPTPTETGTVTVTPTETSTQTSTQTTDVDTTTPLPTSAPQPPVTDPTVPATSLDTNTGTGAVVAPAPSAAVAPRAAGAAVPAPVVVAAPAPAVGVTADQAQPLTLGAPAASAAAVVPAPAGTVASPDLETASSGMPDPTVLALGAGFVVVVGAGLGFLLWRRSRRS